MLLPLVYVLIAGAVLLVGCQATRAGYESAPYKVVRSEGRFQVRDYPSLTIVETKTGGGGEADDGGFGRLFRFITGKNEAKQKIAMTTPVFMSGESTNRSMAFVMPSKMSVEGAPRPLESTVAVREQSAGRFAVLRYAGGRGPEREAESLGRLSAWVAGAGLKVVSGPIYGYFDPPWTPAFLRRNEVMLRVEGEK